MSRRRNPREDEAFADGLILGLLVGAALMVAIFTVGELAEAAAIVVYR